MGVTDLEHFLEDTRGGKIDQLEAWLRVLYRDPPNHAAWLPHLEALLADDRPCVVAIPYHYGEIRWLAAQALAATREQLGIRDPVRVDGVVLPMSGDDLWRAMDAAGIPYPRSKEMQEYFVDLGEAGKLTLVDLDLVGAAPSSPGARPKIPPEATRSREELEAEHGLSAASTTVQGWQLHHIALEVADVRATEAEWTALADAPEENPALAERPIRELVPEVKK